MMSSLLPGRKSIWIRWRRLICWDNVPASCCRCVWNSTGKKSWHSHLRYRRILCNPRQSIGVWRRQSSPGQGTSWRIGRRIVGKIPNQFAARRGSSSLCPGTRFHAFVPRTASRLSEDGLDEEIWLGCFRRRTIPFRHPLNLPFTTQPLNSRYSCSLENTPTP